MTLKEECHETKRECKVARKHILQRVADNRNTHRDNYCVDLVIWIQEFRADIKRRVAS